MFEVIFSNIFLDLHEHSASEEMENRGEDLPSCLWLGTDALLLLSAWDVIFVFVSVQSQLKYD